KVILRILNNNTVNAIFTLIFVPYFLMIIEYHVTEIDGDIVGESSKSKESKKSSAEEVKTEKKVFLKESVDDG
ncbi:hypothetical protein Avbf_07005, partial [Armadillidium vulgare]